MAVVAVVHRGLAVRAALRRGLIRRGARARLAPCRSLDQVHRLLRREVVDAIAVDIRRSTAAPALQLIEQFPGIPLFALSSFRPEDGGAMVTLRRAGIRGLLVDDVDGVAGGEWIAARTASRRRHHLLRDAPALLRLTEPIQLKVWDEVLARVGSRADTADLAGSFGLSREHLSREFGAGGAPNLKRVIDLARICCGADLLENPGYDVGTVSRVLRYASPSHFAVASRRISGVTPAELPRLGMRQVLLRFLKGRTRSRL
jgi:AraC-like DNA-binding protein